MVCRFSIGARYFVMTNQKLAAIAAFPILLALSAAAVAQEESSVTPTLDPPPGVRDLPINPPPGAVVQSQGRFYIWGDAPFTKPQTPTDANGNNPIPGPEDANTVNPTTAPTTQVMRGAVGYVLPGDSVPDKLGSNARIEIGAASATASTSLTPAQSIANPQILTGWTLGGCTNCNTLQSIDYEGRELSVKAATDYKADQLTLTPSVSVFSNRSHQDFVQTNPGTSTFPAPPPRRVSAMPKRRSPTSRYPTSRSPISRSTPSRASTITTPRRRALQRRCRARHLPSSSLPRAISTPAPGPRINSGRSNRENPRLRNF
jgi:hypothetical protein